jgi:hypothetical protein
MPAQKTNPPQTHRSKKALSIAADIKSIIRNTLLASPYFPIIYRAVVRSQATNSNDPKMIAASYKKNIQSALAHRTNTNMTRICTHIKVTGVRCGSPALRGEQFCYFHQRMIRTVRSPRSRLHHVALLENPEAIQASLMEVVNGLIRGTIEVKRGELILRALNTAVRNARHAQFEFHPDMITRIPDYIDPPEPEEIPQQPTTKKPTPAEIYMTAPAAAARVETASTNVETPAPASPRNANANVGTAAPGCPGGPELPGRSAPPTKKNAAIDPTNRKPPASVKRPEAPKERKITAHRASGG